MDERAAREWPFSLSVVAGMDDEIRNQLARKLLTTLPKYSAWLSKLQYFMTPYGRLGLRPLAVLYILRQGAIPEEELSPTSLAHYMDVRPSVVTRALTRLEEGGFIERTMDLDDRRRINITMTEKGQDVSVYVEQLYLREVVGGMHGLEDRQVHQLLQTIDVLDRILTHLQLHGPEVVAVPEGSEE